jgi:hypothetical protein
MRERTSLWGPSAIAFAGCVFGVAATVAAHRWLREAEQAAPVDLASLPAPDAALRREVEDLRALLERIEARAASTAPAPAAAEQSMAEAASIADLRERVGALEADVDALTAMTVEHQPRDALRSPAADADAAAQLLGQVLDPNLGMRVRLDSLQTVRDVDPAVRPFARVDLGQVGAFLAGIPNAEWRRKAYRDVRSHVDRSWLPVLSEAARRETDDAVRSQVIELFAPLVAEADVRAMLQQLHSTPGLGAKARDSIDDLLR